MAENIAGAEKGATCLTSMQANVQTVLEGVRMSFPLLYSAGVRIVRGREESIKLWFYGQYNRALYQAHMYKLYKFIGNYSIFII